MNPRYGFKPIYSLSRRAPSADSDISPWEITFLLVSVFPVKAFFRATHRQVRCQEHPPGSCARPALYGQTTSGELIQPRGKSGMAKGSGTGKIECPFSLRQLLPAGVNRRSTGGTAPSRGIALVSIRSSCGPAGKRNHSWRMTSSPSRWKMTSSLRPSG